MIVEIDPNAGFCFGVEKAIKAAEKALQKDLPVYSLGHIVHNPGENARLSDMGLRETNTSQLQTIAGKAVLIRAHGEPPETYEIIKKSGTHLIDATCPVVLALQKKIKNTWLNQPENQIVIFGKQDHPEIIGLNGGIQYQAIVISDIQADLDKIDFSKPVRLFSQTTQSVERYEELKTYIANRFREAGLNPEVFLKVENSICRQVSKRGPAIKQFSGRHDVIVFVGGANSSNGKYLYGLALSVNSRTYKIENESELQKSWFVGARSAGVSGATSTPQWQMEKVAEAIMSLIAT